MSLEKSNISSTQLTFLIFGFIQTGILPLTYSSGITGRDTWLAVIAALCVSLFFLLIYVALAQKFPGKNLMQINDIIYGAYLGTLISILYILFFLSVAVANLWYVGSFWNTYLMPETPRAAILIMFVFVCVWAARSGIEVIARCSFFVVVIVILISSLVAILLLKDMKITNFLPVLDIPFKDFFQGVHIITSIPFCEMVVFLMVIHNTNQIKQVKRSALLAVILGGIYLLQVSLRDTAVLGAMETISNSPSFIAVRLINVGKILTRMDIFVAIGLMLTVFIKVTVFLYSAVYGIAQSLRLRSYLPLVVPVGIIVIIISMIIFRSDMEQAYYGANIWPFYTIPFEFLIPVISLIIAQIRGLPGKQGGKCG